MQSIAQQKTINPNSKKPSVFRTVFPWRKKQKNLAHKSDDAMFLPLPKAMCLRRDVCLRHVADSRAGSPPPYTKTTAVAVIFCQ